MATCVLDNIANQFAVGTGEKDGKEAAVAPVQKKDDKSEPVLIAPATQGKMWETSDILLAGIVLTMIILSCAVLVYVARR